MNYFGHAAIAHWRGERGAVVLGAMLPDFVNMVGGHLEGEQGDTGVARGIALHHRTDGVFHDLAPVHAQMRELDHALERAGCARGPRLAVGHVGVELLLDGVLVEDAALRGAYAGAIAADAEVAWAEAEATARWEALRTRLRGAGPPDDLRTVAGVVYRLRRILAPRPRLAPSASDLVAIEKAIGAAQARIAIAADTIVRALRAHPDLAGSEPESGSGSASEPGSA